MSGAQRPDHGPMRKGRSVTLVLIGLSIAILLGLALSRDDPMLAWLERRLIYCPSHKIAHSLAVFGVGAEEVRFGEQGRLHGVFVPAERPPSDLNAAARTVVFFHGNGGNLTHRATLMARMRSMLGANVFIFDYQGYGQSQGRPSETATAGDARSAITYLTQRRDVDPARIAYYGESLGGAVAIDLAREISPSGLVVQSAFTSLAQMTRLHYPALGFLLPYASMRYDALAAIRSVQTPLLLIHGNADTLVPADHARHLFEAANEPKRLMIVPEAGHNDVIVKAGSAYWEALRGHPGLGVEAPAPR